MTKAQSPRPKAQGPKPKPELVIGHWSLVIILMLLTWGLRLCWLEAVPPGWRDDELINIHALSGELLAGRFPLYFTGASGHEPLYHYLHAGVHAALGFNVLSGHLLSVACGTLTVPLTYALARRLFGRRTAVVASLALATSFWSLMYSRTAIRHISLPPLALAASYILWRSLTLHSPFSILHPPSSNRSSVIGHFIPLGLILGISLYTYPAARLLPALLVLFAVYLALCQRDLFSRWWRGLLLALVVAAIVATPLGVATAQVAGADARLAELAVPLRELRAGDLRPLLRSTWTTLGMFHATGDPEWLYNIPERPVFNLLGGALFWAGVALCVYRWRRPRYFFLLLWLGLGLLPAFSSTPPASLSHTILAQPVAYILPALALAEGYRWCKAQSPKPRAQVSRTNARRSLSFIVHCSFTVVAAIFLATHAVRDLRDYFITWPERGMVRFLYRADYREAARYLNAHTEITDVAISSALMGPWDRLALEVDVRRADVAARLFDPERALVWAGGDGPAVALFTPSPDPDAPIDGFLTDAGLPQAGSPHLKLYGLETRPVFDTDAPITRFANGLDLLEARWTSEPSLAPGQEAVLLTTWRVAAPLDLPPLPIVANPPPPGVYSGPRLAVFAHVLAADGATLASDDGLWVDPLTLRPGDRFIQVHRLALSPGTPAGPHLLELGLYDPMTGDRWPTLTASDQPGADRFTIRVEEEP